jgi:hypothetical protein
MGISVAFMCDRKISTVEEDGSRFARMPTHAMKLHEWGTQGIDGFYVWATRKSRLGDSLLSHPCRDETAPWMGHPERL